MPAITNIVVRKADGTTDVTYVAQQGASGTAPAIFRNNTVGTTVAERPSLAVRARSNGTGTSRRVDVDFAWPTVSTDAGGNKVVTGRMNGSCSVLVPQNQDAAVIKEQTYQFANLLASALIKASFEEGYAPRSS